MWKIVWAATYTRFVWEITSHDSGKVLSSWFGKYFVVLQNLCSTAQTFAEKLVLQPQTLKPNLSLCTHTHTHTHTHTRTHTHTHTHTYKPEAHGRSSLWTWRRQRCSLPSCPLLYGGWPYSRGRRSLWLGNSPTHWLDTEGGGWGVGRKENVRGGREKE